MDTVTSEWDNYVQRHNDFRVNAANEINQLISILQSTKEHIAKSSDDITKKSNLHNLVSEAKSHTTRAIHAAKDMASLVSKCGKTIDQVFTPSTEDHDWHANAFDGKQAVLHRIIGEHFVRQGHASLALCFQNEAGLDSLDTSDAHFQQLHQFMVQIRSRNLDPCLAWAEENRFDLNRIDSNLEYQLRKLAFLQFLLKSKRNFPVSKDHHIMEAIHYAKQHFSRFPDHIPEIQQLLGFMVFYPTSNSEDPHDYSRFTTSTLWDDLERQFARDYCSLLGLSPDSPLFTTIMVGTSSLPILSRLFSKMKVSKADWTAMYELPVEIPLLPRHNFHSIFTCPVTREQSTEQNPPMMLPCGHTISNESLKKLSRNSTVRFKCPYCPCDTVASQALRLYL